LPHPAEAIRAGPAACDISLGGWPHALRAHALIRREKRERRCRAQNPHIDARGACRIKFASLPVSPQYWGAERLLGAIPSPRIAARRAVPTDDLVVIRVAGVLVFGDTISLPRQCTNRKEPAMAINTHAIAVHNGFYVHLLGGVERISSTCFLRYMRRPYVHLDPASSSGVMRQWSRSGSWRSVL